MPHRSDRDRLVDFIQIIGAEPRETEFDDEGHLVKLNLAGLNLIDLPPEIGQFVHLQKLLLDGTETKLDNQLTHLPSEIGQLANLQVLSLEKNNFTSLPPEITGLINLQELILASNKLTTLPPEIG